MNSFNLKIVTIALFIAASLSCAMPALGQDESTEIDELKAAFVFNFSKYFTWPENEKWLSADQVTVCVSSSVAGKSAFEALNGQVTQGKEISVIDLSQGQVDVASSCHIWYVDRDHLDRNLSELENLENSGVLTVSDHPDFISCGGIIELHLIDNKLRFKIDTNTARREQLSVSSRLLALALKDD